MFGIVHFIRRIWRHPSNRGRRLRALACATAWRMTSAVMGTPTELKAMGGLRLKVYPDSGVAKGLVCYSARPEYHEMGLVQHLLRPGDRFVDVGANIGYYTLLAAALVGPSGAVEAFEPGQPALDRLRENIALNRLFNVRVHALALSDTPGSARFLTGRDTTNRLAASADAASPSSSVPAARLDDLLSGQPCALGKIDVEGAELRVLQGAEGMLSRANPPVWILEVTHRLRDFGASEPQLASWLAARGYDLGSYDADARTFSFGPEPWSGRTNVVAVARSAKADVARRVRE
ncbi:MAG: FkbM family methyltransferase [Planctomycetes bacterium]|nr:FkbM family methyltransferase [Planctomycetota bacterium]